jgi:hypothetical protein
MGDGHAEARIRHLVNTNDKRSRLAMQVDIFVMLQEYVSCEVKLKIVLSFHAVKAYESSAVYRGSTWM